MGLSLTVLGSDGSYAGPRGACSGYLVQAEGFNLVLEMGPGSLANLQSYIDLVDIDAVVLTHSHPDHWVDFTGLRTALKYRFGCEGMHVYGTSETRILAEALTTGLNPTVEWHDVHDGDVVDLGDLQLSFSRTDHYVETLAVRIDHQPSGHTIGYSADTGPGWSLEALGSGIDLALCEATYATDEDVAGILHLSATQAGAMARRAGAARLVLTHLFPDSDEDRFASLAAQTFGAPVEVAHVGRRFDL